MNVYTKKQTSNLIRERLIPVNIGFDWDTSFKVICGNAGSVESKLKVGINVKRLATIPCSRYFLSISLALIQTRRRAPELVHWTSLQAEAASASRFATPTHLSVLLLTKSGKSRGLFSQYNSCRTFIRPLANWRWNWDNRASWLTEKPTFEAYADYRSFPGEEHQEMVFKRRRNL